MSTTTPIAGSLFGFADERWKGMGSKLEAQFFSEAPLPE
jgi:hypothetical protein